MRAYLTEFVGTFFLVATIGLSVIGGPPGTAPLAIGAVLMAMIFMGGHVSGAHYNPAVTLAVFLRGGGKLKAIDFIPYIIAQVAGAVAAAAIVRYVLVDKDLPLGAITGSKIFPALVAEFLFTCALARVILNVATAKGTSGNSFYGLAIGFTVTAGAIAVGGISGGAFNPAVGLALPIMGASWANLWIHLAGPLAGGAVAAMFFKIQNPDD
jgi:aquaporin Z